MTLGKLQKKLNKWQGFALLGRDPVRKGYWRWELWCMSLLQMPIEGGPLQKHFKGQQMYRGFIVGNSYRIPEIIMRKFAWLPFAVPIKIRLNFRSAPRR